MAGATNRFAQDLGHSQLGAFTISKELALVIERKETSVLRVAVAHW